MSDVNIIASIDTAEIDAALAKLDAALEKSNRLQGQITGEPQQPTPTQPATEPPLTIKDDFTVSTPKTPSQNTENLADLYIAPPEELKQPYIMEPDLSGFYAQIEAAKTQVEATVADGQTKLADLTAQAETVKAQLDQQAPENWGPLYDEVKALDPKEWETDVTVSEGQAKLAELAADAEAVGAAVDNVVAEKKADLEDLKSTADASDLQVTDLINTEGTEIKGLEQSTNRVIRMLPGLREADRLRRNVEQIRAGNIVGALGLFLLAYTIYKQLESFLEQQKRERTEYQRLIMESKNFTTTEQFKTWQADQNRLVRGYSTGVIP